MTGDELAAALYAEQGYLIGGSRRDPGVIGKIYKPAGFGELKIATPLRIIGSATKSEYLSQLRLAERISGLNFHGLQDLPSVHYYRVEAAD